MQDMTTDPQERDGGGGGGGRVGEERRGETDGCQMSGGLWRQKWDCGITCSQLKEDESEERWGG